MATVEELKRRASDLLGHTHVDYLSLLDYGDRVTRERDAYREGLDDQAQRARRAEYNEGVLRERLALHVEADEAKHDTTQCACEGSTKCVLALCIMADRAALAATAPAEQEGAPAAIAPPEAGKVPKI